MQPEPVTSEGSKWPQLARLASWVASKKERSWTHEDHRTPEFGFVSFHMLHFFGVPDW